MHSQVPRITADIQVLVPNSRHYTLSNELGSHLTFERSISSQHNFVSAQGHLAAAGPPINSLLRLSCYGLLLPSSPRRRACLPSLVSTIRTLAKDMI